MGRTILYILIGVSVVGALAVLLLITPVPDTKELEQSMTQDSQATTQVDESTQTVTPVLDEPVEADVSTEQPSTDPVQEPAPSVEGPLSPSFSIDGVIVSGEYPHETTVAGIDVYWANDAQHLRVGLVSPGTGFIAIGFDPESQMEGANYIIASVHEGELTIRDDYGHEPLAHIEDTTRGGQDNILDAAGNQWADQTVVEFLIPLDSGDLMDKPLLPGHEYTILAAYHSMDDSFSARHTRRGTGQMKLDLPIN